MFSDNKAFRIALIISAIVHGSIIVLPHIKLLPPFNQNNKSELTYLKTKTDDQLKLQRQLIKRNISPKEKPLPLRDIIKPVPPKWDESLYKSNAPRPLSSLFTKERLFKKPDDFLTNKPQLSKPDVIAIKKKIALTPVELKKITSPSYISYYQIVREKIRRCAYQNYTSQDTGEVYISFVIASDGNLINAKVIEEKSTPNSYLKEIALKSLKDASLFPAFPKDLDYPELSFNVIISFEIE